MRNILSKRDLRHLNLIEILNMKRELTPLRELNEILSVPIRTIHSDIQEINSYIHPLVIRSCPTGVRLVIPENYSLAYIYKLIFENSQEFRLIEYIFVNEKKSLEQVSSALFISESTTKRIIKKLNTIFSEHNFKISTSPMAIIGDEKKITQFLSSYFQEKYTKPDFIEQEERTLIHEIIKDLFDDTGKELHFNKLKKYTIWIYIGIIRMKHNHQVHLDNNRVIDIPIIHNKVFCARFYRQFGFELTLNTFTQLIYARTTEKYIVDYFELEVRSKIDSNLADLKENVETKIKDLISQTSLKINKASKESVILDVINLTRIRDYYIFILFDRREYFLSRLSDNYRQVKTFIRPFIEDITSPSLNEDEINELTYILLTHLPGLFDKLRFIEKKILIHILVDTDVEHAQFIKKELDTYSRFNIRTKIMYDYSFDEIYKLNKDQILITTIPGIENTECKVLCFTDYFSSRNWHQLNELIIGILNEDN